MTKMGKPSLESHVDNEVNSYALVQKAESSSTLDKQQLQSTKRAKSTEEEYKISI